MILACQNISLAFGDKEIIKNASFHIEEREKTALIGNNGAGKTTLLRIIVKELPQDEGQVIIAKDKELGYLAQYQDLASGRTIHQELLATRQDLLDMEERIRSLELEMKSCAPDQLEDLMETYTRLNHQFELHYYLAQFPIKHQNIKALF